MEHISDLYQHFTVKDVKLDMYASDWLFALFSNIIHLSYYHHFLDGFFKDGWSFFYKFSLSFLKSLKPELLACTDQAEIFYLIKLKHVKQEEAKREALKKQVTEESSSDYTDTHNDCDSSSYQDETSSIIHPDESEEHL